MQRHAPNAVLLDVRLGDDDGFEVCGTLTRARPGLAVLLASDTDYEHSNDALARAGACGFIRKSHPARTPISSSSGRAAEPASARARRSGSRCAPVDVSIASPWRAAGR